MSKVVATAIYLGVFVGSWWFLQTRVRILGRSPEAKRASQRNAVLLCGVFGILILQTWVPSSSRAYIGGIGISIVLVTYTLMLVESIRRRRRVGEKS
jgi:hypothetical protein